MDFYNKPVGEKSCFSPCGNYRYKRWIKWSNERPCVFILLNPKGSPVGKRSKTVKNCEAIAKNNKCGGIIIANLYAHIADSAKELGIIEKNKNIVEINQGENEEYLESVLKTPNALIIVGWGSGLNLNIDNMNKQKQNFQKLTAKLNIGNDILCLDFVSGKNPIHPGGLTAKEANNISISEMFPYP